MENRIVVDRKEFVKTMHQFGYSNFNKLGRAIGVSDNYFSQIFARNGGGIPKDKILALQGLTGYDWSKLEVEQPASEVVAEGSSEEEAPEPTALVVDDGFWEKLEAVMYRAFTSALKGE